MKRKNFFKLNIGGEKTKILKQNRLLLLSFLFFFLFSAWVKVFAFAWPYNPGAILDPGCAPTDTDCTVSLLGSLNGLNGTSQTFAIGTTGSDFNIDSTGTVHTFNFPDASVSARGLLTSTDWNTFNNKQDALSFSTGLTNTANTITNNLSTGILGGQSVVGGTASGDNLTLSSTSHVTKGSILFGSSVYDEANNRMAIGTTTFDNTNPEKLLIDAGITSSVNAISAKGTINNYFQLNIRNLSSGTSASSDIVATADNGSETTGYIDMGINSSGYTNGVMGVANDAYLYNIASGSGGDLVIGAGSSGKSLYFLTGGTSKTSNKRFQIDGLGNATFTQGLSTSGTPTALTLTAGAHLGLTASVEANDVNFNLARTVSFLAGSLSMQRAFLVQAPTYAFASTSTLTDAATMAITGAPIKGTNATITNSHGLLIQAGAVSTATNAYGLTVNAPTGATTNLAAQFLDSATMSGAETFYPNADFLRSGGTEGVKIGYWSRTSGVAEGGAVMSRSSNGLILGTINSGTPQRALTIQYNGNSPSMFLGLSSSPNVPYDFGMNGAISFYAVPNTTKWTGLVTSGIYTSSNGPIIYGSNGVNGSSFGDLVLSSRALAAAQVGIVTGATPTVRMKINGTGDTTFTQGVSNTGSPVAFTLNGASHLTLTASTEASDVNFNLARPVQFNTGTITSQRAFRIQAPTYSFVGASTITDAATFAVSGGPTAGTNATITNSYSIWSQSGKVRIDGVLASAVTDSTVCISTTGVLTKSNAACTAASSRRFKHDITTLNSNTLLGQVLALRPVSFVYNENNALSLGFIAEEVNDINPLLVAYEDDGVTPRGLHYDKFVTLLTGAVQEMNIEIKGIESLDLNNTNSVGYLVKQFLADQANTIENIFAKKVTTKELCLDDVCINADQLREILKEKNISSNTVQDEPIYNPPTPLPQPEVIPPVLDNNELPPTENI